MTPRNRTFPALMAVLLLAGCASQYLISTNDGTMIQTDNKPKLNAKTGMYEYRDRDGKDASIKQSEVKQILER